MNIRLRRYVLLPQILIQYILYSLWFYESTAINRIANSSLLITDLKAPAS
ncbi:unnamed protein product [Brassica oleracea]